MEKVEINIAEGDLVNPPNQSNRGLNEAIVHHKKSDGKYQRNELKPGTVGAFDLPKTVEPGDIIEFRITIPGRFEDQVHNTFVKVTAVSKDKLSGNQFADLDAAKKESAKKTETKEPTTKKKSSAKSTSK